MPTARRSPWIISPAADLAVFIGVTLTALIPWVLADRLHVRGFYCLCRPAHLVRAGVYSVVVAGALLTHAALSVVSLTLWTGLTLGHYYLDGVIWKFKDYDLRILF